MKVLDANFLIDYLAGDGSTKEFYEANGGDEELWIMPDQLMPKPSLESETFPMETS